LFGKPKKILFQKKEKPKNVITNPIIAHFRRKVGIRFPDPLGIVEQVGG